MKTRILIFISFILISISIGYGLYTYSNPKIEIKEIEKIVEEKVYVNKYITKEIEVETKVPSINYSHFKHCLINFDAYMILQNPELPTGCEATSLTMVLNFLGEEVTKTEIVDNYLPKGGFGTHDPRFYFLGSPYLESGGGCYAPAIEQTVKNYNSEINVTNLSGTDFYELRDCINNGNPIIFWATIDMQPSVNAYYYNFDGQEVVWKYYEHCLVLIGYDEDKDVYYIADPLKGIVEYNRTLVEERYNEMNKQALLIWKDNS